MPIRNNSEAQPERAWYEVALMLEKWTKWYQKPPVWAAAAALTLALVFVVQRFVPGIGPTERAAYPPPLLVPEVVQGYAKIPVAGVLDIDGIWIHLFGLRPPREDADCRLRGAIFDCTLINRARIAELIGDEIVRCNIQDVSRDDRVWGICHAAESRESINRTLAVTGWAFAEPTHTDTYVQDAALAQLEKRGMWAGVLRRRTLANAVDPEMLAGNATVRAAGIIEIDEIDIYLFGIDAPVMQQTCSLNGISYQCGLLAHAHLLEITSGKTIVCQVRQFSGDERVHGICGFGDETGRRIVQGVPTINEQMVLSGWALSELTAALDLTRQEARARDSRIGLWQGEFIAPSEWLAGRR